MFTIPNILTGLNLVSGIVSILFTFTGRIELAVLFIFIGALFDFLDGLVARLLKQSNNLGKQLDSLADMVTFGVAPGMIIFVLLILSGVVDAIIYNGLPLSEFWKEGTMGHSINYWIQTYFNQLSGNSNSIYPKNLFNAWSLILPFGALLIPFFSLFRLAKFNIDERQTTSFIGLPTPANSIFFASFALLLWDGYDANNWKSSLSLTLIKDQVLMTFVIVFSFLLVSEIKLFSLKISQLTFKGNEVRILFLSASILLFIFFYVWAIPLIIILYILLSLLLKKRP